MPRPNGKRLPGDPLRHIPLVERRKLVAHAFSGVIEAIELEEDLTVYRHWGGKSAKTIACLQPDRRVEIEVIGTSN